MLALGGNALLRRGDPVDPAIQEHNVERAAAAILAAVPAGDRLVVTHGNGPQVGLLAIADAARGGGPPFPLDVLDAESEGMIGYLLARHLHRAGAKPVAAVLTQVVVDPADPAFAQPTKPVGAVYREEEIRVLARRHGWQVAPDAGAETTGWRRVVASPPPRSIVEIEAVRALLDAGVTVVCGGGGGVPVANDGDRLTGVEAVVDKDATSALLAEQLGADRLVLVTDVECVVSGWGTPAARPIATATPGDLAQEAFAAGSMGPKVAAACAFVQHTGGAAAIGSLDQLAQVLAGQAGTRIAP